MAKKRRVRSRVEATKGASTGSTVASSEPASADWKSALERLDPLLYATGLLGAILVYVVYYPSDSVAVESGDALWFAALSLIVATLTLARKRGQATKRGQDSLLPALSIRVLTPFILALGPWALGTWVMLAAFATSPPGNLRMATNEGWLWLSAAAIFTAARVLMATLEARRAIFALMVVCASGLAVHGLHQYFVSLPQNRLDFQRDPEKILQLVGIEAPPGSAERMVFANRLFDGGPTGTFALANSLAAVLLVGVVLPVGVMRFRWRELTSVGRVTWGMVAIGCAGCLMATRSRSAILATLVSIALLWVVASRGHGVKSKKVLVGMLGLLGFGLAGALFLAFFGNREWFEEAPSSLAFRFQYWRTTWQMVLDHPLFGIGPGNFQSFYERYREANTTEQIAEPHNLFFETLASGGFIGLGSLLVLLVSGVVYRFRSALSERGNEECDESTSENTDRRTRWVFLGAILSWVMVWVIGFAVRLLPDLEASLYVVPVVLVIGLAIWPSVRQLGESEIDAIFVAAMCGMAIHLMVAGGWTVPGVAIFIWIGAGTLTRVGLNVRMEGSSDRKLESPGNSKPGNPTQSNSKPKFGLPSFAFAGIGIVLLAALYVMSLRPVETRRRLMQTAASQQSRGQMANALATLENAVEADRWSCDAMLWLADIYRWKMILLGDTKASRQAWESSLAEAKRRGGEDPAIYRMVGIQQLHLYQTRGREDDLRAAADSFEKATHWSPANQWMMAQMAVVADALGRSQESARYAQRASVLSELGGNIERQLSRQSVFVPQVLGNAALQGPVRHPADQLLDQLSNPRSDQLSNPRSDQLSNPRSDPPADQLLSEPNATQ